MTAEMAAASSASGAPRGGEALDYARALQNILEDSASEQCRLRETHSAVLNILEDAASEKDGQQKAQVAMLNMLEDLSERTERLEETERAVLNILEDLAVEKRNLEEAQGELQKTEQAVRVSLHEKETLLKEIHHRVKNNLQVIASLLRLQSRGTDEQVRSMFDESQNRVLSISLVHEMLYQAGDLARLEFGGYLQSLTSQLLKSWTGTADIELTVDAGAVQLGVDTAIPCGLIVNELVTNALKHAFLNRARGAVRVRLEPAPDEWLKLSVEDDGVGLPKGMARGRPGSLGLELVATLVRQLRGRMEIQHNGGSKFEIFFQTPGGARP